MDMVLMDDRTDYFNERLGEDAIRKIVEINKFIDKRIMLFGKCNECFSVSYYISYMERYGTMPEQETFRDEYARRPVYYDREKEQFTAYTSRLMVTEQFRRFEKDPEGIYVPDFVSRVEIWDRIRGKKYLKLGREVQDIRADRYDILNQELVIHKENPYLKLVDGVLYRARGTYIDEIIGLSLQEADALFLQYARNGNRNYVELY